MGGLGSGWQGFKKDVVDDCMVLSIKALVRERVLVPGAYRRGSLTWQCDGSDFEYESELRQDGTGSLFLRCVGPGQQFCHWVSLCSTVPHYGGRRWWFICPVKKIRAAKLHLPPGATQFASRNAHNLTYRSSRESGWRKRSEKFWRRMAQRLDGNP